MSKKDDGGPAFPVDINEGSLEYPKTKHYPGLSLRDLFAGQALASMIIVSGVSDAGREAMKQLCESEKKTRAEVVASGCYAYADAMLAERNKE